MEGVTPDRLRAAFLKAMQPKPSVRVTLDHVAPIRASVRDAVGELRDELPRTGRITFRRLTSGLAERLEIVVRFLAVLELFKQGAVDLEQVESFGEITIVWLGGGFDPLSASSQLLADAETYD
jgi:segregation and condensation protein A